MWHILLGYLNQEFQNWRKSQVSGRLHEIKVKLRIPKPITWRWSSWVKLNLSFTDFFYCWKCIILHFFLACMALCPVKSINEYNYLKKTILLIQWVWVDSIFLHMSNITGFSQSKSTYSTKRNIHNMKSMVSVIFSIRGKVGGDYCWSHDWTLFLCIWVKCRFLRVSKF